MLLLRSISKTYCIQLLPLQSSASRLLVVSMVCIFVSEEIGRGRCFFVDPMIRAQVVVSLCLLLIVDRAFFPVHVILIISST